MLKVTVIGTGYVGLVSGACLASLGIEVVCVDSRKSIVDQLNSGVSPIYENGLEELIELGVNSGLLSFTSSLENAILDSDISLVTVGTPSRNGILDISQILSVAEEIGTLLPEIKPKHTVVLKSTCLPGTTNAIVGPILQKKSRLSDDAYGLGANPEFLREGTAVEDFLNPDRIIIGYQNQIAYQSLHELYKSFDCPKLATTTQNAEMIKYTSNTLLATLISFSNEIANICRSYPGLDEPTVMEGVHLDRRLTHIETPSSIRETAMITSFIRAGIGYGGSCLPKDTIALKGFTNQIGLHTPMLDATISINENRSEIVVNALENHIGGIEGKKITILGLAFKPGTDDVRESPGLKIADKLLQRNANIVGWDPVAFSIKSGEDKPTIPVLTSLKSALADADAAIITTPWKELSSCNWSALCSSMSSPIIVDGRGVFEKIPAPKDARIITIGKNDSA